MTIMGIIVVVGQQAEALVQGGCPQALCTNPAGHYCANHHEDESIGSHPTPSCTSPNAFKNSNVYRSTGDLMWC